jgi:hypothetical protein
MKHYLETMAEVADFPFVAELPKREKGRIATLWDKFQEAREIIDREGVLVPPSFAAKVMNVSKQRVCQLMDSGRLKRVDFDGQSLVTENSIVEWAKAEHKGGRPINPASARQIAKAASEIFKK